MPFYRGSLHIWCRNLAIGTLQHAAHFDSVMMHLEYQLVLFAQISLSLCTSVLFIFVVQIFIAAMSFTPSGHSQRSCRWLDDRVIFGFFIADIISLRFRRSSRKSIKQRYFDGDHIITTIKCQPAFLYIQIKAFYFLIDFYKASFLTH